MNRELTISHDSIDEAALIASRAMSNGMGAAIYFSGVVRGTEDEDSISA
ncbi:MAG: molybdopterin synthase catalytic subunit, partial [Candidatus Binatia bacterium]